MAKQDGVINVTGKLDNKVYIRGRKGLNYVRAAIKPGAKRGKLQ